MTNLSNRVERIWDSAIRSRSGGVLRGKVILQLYSGCEILENTDLATNKCLHDRGSGAQRQRNGGAELDAVRASAPASANCFRLTYRHTTPRERQQKASSLRRSHRSRHWQLRNRQYITLVHDEVHTISKFGILELYNGAVGASAFPTKQAEPDGVVECNSNYIVQSVRNLQADQKCSWQNLTCRVRVLATGALKDLIYESVTDGDEAAALQVLDRGDTVRAHRTSFERRRGYRLLISNGMIFLVLHT